MANSYGMTHERISEYVTNWVGWPVAYQIGEAVTSHLPPPLTLPFPHPTPPRPPSLFSPLPLSLLLTPLLSIRLFFIRSTFNNISLSVHAGMLTVPDHVFITGFRLGSHCAVTPTCPTLEPKRTRSARVVLVYIYGGSRPRGPAGPPPLYMGSAPFPGAPWEGSPPPGAAR